MKTIEQRGKVKRVSNDEAFKLVSEGIAKYVPKAAWKAIRDMDKKPSKTKASEELVVDELPERGITITEVKTKKEKKPKN